jgi:hypothetical protein
MFKKLLSAALLAWLLSGAALSAQVPRTGQQIPPMPRLRDTDAPGWISLGIGLNGFMAAFSHQEKKIVGTLHAGYQWGSGRYSVGNLGLTAGPALTSGPLFAAVGGGVGCLIGWLDPGDRKTRTIVCLDGVIQLGLRFNSRLGLGLYSTVAVNSKKTLGGVFLSLQYGHWKTV